MSRNTPIGKLRVELFHLRHTLETGQFFRWFENGGCYYIHTRNYFFKAWQEGAVLCYQNASEKFIRHFFSLDHDLKTILRSIAKDRHICAAVERFRGLRLLRQDPWECLTAFILSSASNIPRITRNLNDIAWQGRDGRRCGDFTSYTFPRPPKLGALATSLYSLRLGFRASYLVSTAREIGRRRLLKRLTSLPYPSAKNLLMSLDGVGEKIADCVLLFGYGHLGTFPIDTWIRRLMGEFYFGGKRVSDRTIQAFATSYFGAYAGYAQQYFYSYARLGRGVKRKDTILSDETSYDDDASDAKAVFCSF